MFVLYWRAAEHGLQLAYAPSVAKKRAGMWLVSTSTEEMAKWKKMTAGMGALSVAVTALVLATEEHHHADPDAPVVRKTTPTTGVSRFCRSSLRTPCQCTSKNAMPFRTPYRISQRHDVIIGTPSHRWV